MTERFGSSRKTIAKGAAAAVLLAGGAYAVHNQEDMSRQLRQEQKTVAAQKRELSHLAGNLAIVAHGNRDTLLGKNLRQVPASETGEGLNMHLAQQARASEVMLLARSRGTNADWFQNCSATKISEGSQSFVLTAKHCFTGGLKGGGALPNEVDLLKSAPDEYAVALPGQRTPTPPNDVFRPLADVTGISIELDGPDWALLKVAETPAYDRIPSLPARYLDKLQAPLGMTTEAHSTPVAAGGSPVVGKGRYLGRYTIPASAQLHNFASGINRVDLVGLTNATTPATDACNFGGSGSIDVIGSYITGPLTGRIGSGYAKSPEGYEYNNGDDPSLELADRLTMEKQTGLDLSSFGTICGYAVGSTAVVNALENGFGNYLPPYQGPYGNGQMMK